MIKVNYNDKSIKVSGHANFNTYGNDIVCASVSSIIYTTINGILNIDSKLDLLRDLEKQYPKNIKIVKEN